MNEPIASVYQRFADAQPLVRPTYNQFEVEFLPPYGDPEVHVPSEVGTYFLTGLFINVLIKFLQSDSR